MPQWQIFNMANIAFNAIRENKIFAKTFEFTVVKLVKWLEQIVSYGSRCEKTCLWGFRQSEIQISLLSYRD